MGKFPFKVSLVDMFRKIAANFVNPIDYVDRFVEALAQPGAEIDISFNPANNPTEIGLASPLTLEDRLFSDIRSGDPATISRFIPPGDYRRVTISSGQNQLAFGDSKRFEFSRLEQSVEGTIISIELENEKDAWTHRKEMERLHKMYEGTPLSLSVKGKPLKQNRDGYQFSREGFAGTVAYNRYTKGGINFYHHGRKVEHEPFLDCIDVRLYDHDIPVTMTFSGIIRKGNDGKKYAQFKSLVPSIMIEMLTSDYAMRLREKSEGSYQNLLRRVAFEFPDYQDIINVVRENVQFLDKNQRWYSLDKLNEKRAAALAEDKPERHLYKLLTGVDLPNPEPKGERKKFPLWIPVAIAGALAVGYVMANPSAFHKQSLLTQQLVTQPASSGGLQLEENIGYVDGVMSRESLAQDILGMAGGITGDQTQGYVLEDTFNHVQMIEGNTFWDKKEPVSELQSDIYLSLPDELDYLKTAPRREKIDAVADYIRTHFEYDAILPSDMSEYSNSLEAMIHERKAICSTANTYAAVLLEELDVTDIYYATGTFAGIPHAWLVEMDGEGNPTRRTDATPTRINEELSDIISQYGGFGAVPFLNPLELYQVLGEGRVRLPNNSDLVAIVNHPFQYFTQSMNLLGELISLGGVAALMVALGQGAHAFGRYLLGDRKSKGKLSAQGIGDNYLTKVQDLLGGQYVVQIGENSGYNPATNTISVAANQVEENNYVMTALNAASCLPKEDRIQVLRGILNVVK